MSRYILLLDTETSIRGHCIDFACIIYDTKQKIIVNQCAVLINEFFFTEELFHNQDGFFSKENLANRKAAYKNMLTSGERMLTSIHGINKWLQTAAKTYEGNLSITAYNFIFDKNVCIKSGILLPDVKSFCLWNLSCKLFASRKGYIKFALKHKLFTAKHTMQTSAEVMFRYISDNPNAAEKHEALDDVISFELPILQAALKQKQSFKCDSYAWRKYQLPLVVEQLGITL